jgi:hypothetical protein
VKTCKFREIRKDIVLPEHAKENKPAQKTERKSSASSQTTMQNSSGELSDSQKQANGGFSTKPKETNPAFFRALFYLYTAPVAKFLSNLVGKTLVYAFHFSAHAT